MGPSGCGKTTLMRILLGLEGADEGRVEGVPYGKISAVFQEDRLCENVSAIRNLKAFVRQMKQNYAARWSAVAREHLESPCGN